MREHVVAAANAMKCGDWKKCRDYILDIKVIVCVCILLVSLGSCFRDLGRDKFIYVTYTACVVKEVTSCGSVN